MTNQKMNLKGLSILLILSCVLLLSCKQEPITMKQIFAEKAEMVIRHPSNYILLPIQENAPEIKIIIHSGKEPISPLHIRLATDKVDYYVPYPVESGTKEISIEYTGDIGNIQWDKIRTANSFDMDNREKFRPLYHHSPSYGWMNDPNGLVYLEGEYHLFYQWNPYGSMWGNLHWGHAVSNDLIHWEHLGMAIAPDSLGAVFSGNCVIDKNNDAGFGKNAMIAFYTSAGEKQSQSIAYSLDKGRTFIKYGKNPVLASTKPDFRDPKIIYHEPSKRWIMIVAAGQEVEIYSSTNLLDWRYESSFGEGYGNHEGVWECPDLLELPIDGDANNKKWVLLLNINPGGNFGGSATQYFTGHFDGKIFSCESSPSTTKWMDWGKDHYATITWSNTPHSRPIAIAWMSNWQYANQVPTYQFRSANSVPREISLFTRNKELYLVNHPVEELKSLRAESREYQATIPDRYKSFSVDSILENNNGAFELEIEFKNETAEVFGLTLFNEKGENVIMYYDLSEKRFYMDRSTSGEVGFSKDFPAITYAPIEKTDHYKLRIFVDRSSIECFSGDGKFVMTNLVFPNEPYNRVNFYTKGGRVDIKSLKIYRLKI